MELVSWCGSWCVELVEWRRLGGDVLGRGHVEVVHQLLEVVLPAGPGILSRVEIEGQGCAPLRLGLRYATRKCDLRLTSPERSSAPPAQKGEDEPVVQLLGQRCRAVPLCC